MAYNQDGYGNIQISLQDNAGHPVEFIDYRMREYGGCWRSIRMWQLYSNTFDNKVDCPIALSEKTDIMLRCKAISAGAVVSGAIIGWRES